MSPELRSVTGTITRRPSAVVTFVVAVSLATGALMLLGGIAIEESRHLTLRLLERRQAEALALASAALNRDMRGVWTTVLAPINPALLEEEPPYDVRQLTIKAFARFPYPESFVVWRQALSHEWTYVFNRGDRTPPWDRDPSPNDSFPVVLRRDPPEVRPMIVAARRAVSTSSFVSLTSVIGGTRYAVVGHVIVSPTVPHHVSTLIAFTVNLDWVRAHYFGPLLKQVSQIGQGEDAVILAVSDAQGRLVASSGPDKPSGPTLQRTFPLLFIDPAAVSLLAADRLKVEDWTIKVWTAEKNPSVSAQAAAAWLFGLMVLAGAVSVVALVVTVRAVRADTRLTSMKSDFVTAVTHELKTPVAAIRLVADTLANQRYSSATTVEEYGGLIAQETTRLSRSIDNHLAYSQYAESSQVPATALAPLELVDLFEDALEPFRPVIADRGLTLNVTIPSGLPQVLGDRQALIQVLESIIDNAIKYSSPASTLIIVGEVQGSRVRFHFTDEGIGIPAGDLHHVFERFYRGHNARERGSGLGLTIAERIIQYHRGSIAIQSTVDVGTTVELTLPIAR
jgi:signal transduction histidine kinase